MSNIQIIKLIEQQTHVHNHKQITQTEKDITNSRVRRRWTKQMNHSSKRQEYFQRGRKEMVNAKIQLLVIEKSQYETGDNSQRERNLLVRSGSNSIYLMM